MRELHATIEREDAPILIDQEGGKVARLAAPNWRAQPPPAAFGRLARAAPRRAIELAALNARLAAAELHDVGISVNCAPVLDVADPGMHEAIGNRAFSADPVLVEKLGRAVTDGLLAGGVLPVIKHLPGHGRARVDSHVEKPMVEAERSALRATDFAPFRALCHMPMGIVAHVVYRDLDPRAPASMSSTVISEIIRGDIGFDGLLLSDDLNMAALEGPPAARATAALRAGCDVAVHCNGVLAEMVEAAVAVGPLSEPAVARWSRALAWLCKPQPFDRETAADTVATELRAMAPAG